MPKGDWLVVTMPDEQGNALTLLNVSDPGVMQVSSSSTVAQPLAGVGGYAQALREAYGGEGELYSRCTIALSD